MTFYNLQFGFINPINQILFPDKRENFYVIINKASKKIIAVLDNDNDINNFDFKNVDIIKTDLITIFINDILYHNKNMTKVEAVIWAYGYFERISLESVLKHFECIDLTCLRAVYYKDPALFKYRMATYLNFDPNLFDKNYSLEELNEN